MSKRPPDDNVDKFVLSTSEVGMEQSLNSSNESIEELDHDPNEQQNTKNKKPKLDNQTRIPAIKFTISKNVQKSYQNPSVTKAEILKHKSIDIKKIKFINVQENLIIIVTDDQNTYNLLKQDWPSDAFTNGIRFKDSISTEKINIVIKGVHTEIDLNEEEIKNELQEQGISNAERIFRRSDNAPTTIVKAQVQTKSILNSILSNSVIICLKRHKCEPSRTIIQCFNCQKVGHTHFNCTSTSACMKCGEVHRQNSCTNNLIKCINCQGEHYASARTCPYLKEASKEVIKNELKKNDFYSQTNSNFLSNSKSKSYAQVVNVEQTMSKQEVNKIID